MSKVRVTTSELAPRFSELVLNELDPDFSRSVITLAPHETDLPFGGLVAKGADGKYTAWKAGATGRPALLFAEVGACAEDEDVAAITGYAIVNANLLAVDEAQKAEAVSALEKVNIKVENAELAAEAAETAAENPEQAAEAK